MKTTIALTTVILLSFAPASAQPPGDVYLGDVEGLTTGSIVIDGSGVTEVTFTFHFHNNDAVKVRGFSNGFEFSGSDSTVTWDSLTYWVHPSFPVDPWDLTFFAPVWWHGNGADTIGFGNGSILGNAIPVGYDGPAPVFRVAMSDTSSIGGQFCIDSCWYPPNGVWIWSFGTHSTPPSWDGPHCYPIIGSCCVGQRGNVDGDPEDQLDIADLVYLGDYMFNGGPAPPCWDEADIDGDGGSVIDISDLVYMLEFMFNGGPPPPDCP